MGANDAAPTQRKTRGNLVPLLIGQALMLVAGFSQQILLARYLGKADYGVVGFVLGVCGLFFFLANADLGILITRRVSLDADEGPNVVWDAAWITSLTATLAVSCVVVYIGVSDGRTELLIAGLLSAAAMGFDAYLYIAAAVAHGLDRVRLRAPAQVTGRLVGLATIIAMLLLNFGVVGVFIGQLTGAICGALVMWYLLHTRAMKLQPQWPNFARIKSLSIAAIPFAGRALFGAIYLASDILIIQMFHSDDEVGLYRSAATLTTQLPIVAVLMAQVAYPSMSRTVGDPDESGRVLGFVLRQQLAIGVPVVVGGVLLAGPLMMLLYGEAYADAWLPFAVLLGVVPFRFANVSIGMSLSALGRQNLRARAVLIAAVFNVTANLIVIPTYGAIGAAVTTLLTDSLLTVVMFWSLRGAVSNLRVAGTLVRILLSAATMGVVVWMFSGLHVVITVLAGMVCYTVIGYVLRAWSPAELKKLRSM